MHTTAGISFLVPGDREFFADSVLICFILLLFSLQICYHVLGLVHGIWTPIPRTVRMSLNSYKIQVKHQQKLFVNLQVAVYLFWQMKDYIATPKPNGYQSLHTTVIPFLYESMLRLELQVLSDALFEHVHIFQS